MLSKEKDKNEENEMLNCIVKLLVFYAPKISFSTEDTGITTLQSIIDKFKRNE